MSPDVSQILLTALSSGVVAAGVSGLFAWRAEVRRNRLENNGVRRRVRAAAWALAIRVMLVRKWGTIDLTSLAAKRDYLDEVIKDPATARGLSDKGLSLISDAADLCQIFIDSSRTIGDNGLETTQEKMSFGIAGTFLNLREYFVQDGSLDIVAQFDEAEAEYRKLQLIRSGQGPR